jgi:hypothetical protein
MQRVLEEIAQERARQEHLLSIGKFTHTCASIDGMSEHARMTVLTEEYLEADELARAMLRLARGVNDRDELTELRKELVQIAAVAAAWVESIDTRIELSEG